MSLRDGGKWEVDGEMVELSSLPICLPSYLMRISSLLTYQTVNVTLRH